MDLYARIAGLRLEIDGYELQGLERDVSSEFTRRTTVVRLRGDGEEGVGEDVTYDGAEQAAQQAAGPVHKLSGSHTLDSFSQLVAGLDLFPATAPRMPVARLYRRWAFESAALDLALRQAGRSLGDVLEREPRPVRFVVSLRLGEQGSLRPLERLLGRYRGTRFKLDPTSDWTPELCAALAALAAVDVVDLKGAYKGTIVDQPADATLYRRVAEAFPEALIEDPDLSDPKAARTLEPHRERVTWDAPIHSFADVEALPFPPRTLDVKPSRFGSLRRLLEFYDACAARGIALYGGGQFELGPGRGQIQYLASLLHADAPNDVAPGGYNDLEPADGLPTSPLEPALEPVGFRRKHR
jgi:L-alanine-DL-glutamate epimerase-like enolase superfamily enzyme